MTIRDNINKQLRWTRVAQLLGLSLWTVPLGILPQTHSGANESPALAVIGLLLLVVAPLLLFGGALVILYRIRCPRCRDRLDSVCWVSWMSVPPRIQACPCCGVVLDSDLNETRPEMQGEQATGDRLVSHP